MKGTVKELSQLTGINPATLGQILQLAPEAKIVGQGPKPARGRSAAIWEVSDTVTVSLVSAAAVEPAEVD